MNYLKAHRLKVIFIVLFLMIAVASVWFFYIIENRKHMHQDYYRSILSEAPCIANVCPDLKGQNEVVELLTIDDFLTSNQDGLVGYQIGTNSNFNDIVFGSVTLNSNEVVTVIDLNLDGLTLETALEILGEPEYALTIFGCGVGRRVRTKLLYPTQGIEITLDIETKQRDSITLEYDNTIISIVYFRPDDFYNYMIKSIGKDYLYATEFSSSSENMSANDLFQQIMPWQGLNIPINTVDICLLD